MVAARRVCAALLIGYIAFLAAVLMEYNPVVATDVVSRSGSWLDAHGVPAAMAAPDRVEFLLNAAMFTPAAFLAAMTFPRHHWANWVVCGFIGSGAVELLQGLLLPPRSAQFEDVVANTLGALVGALAAASVARALAGRR